MRRKGILQFGEWWWLGCSIRRFSWCVDFRFIIEIVFFLWIWCKDMSMGRYFAIYSTCYSMKPFFNGMKSVIFRIKGCSWIRQLVTTFPLSVATFFFWSTKTQRSRLVERVRGQQNQKKSIFMESLLPTTNITNGFGIFTWFAAAKYQGNSPK